MNNRLRAVIWIALAAILGIIVAVIVTRTPTRTGEQPTPPKPPKVTAPRGVRPAKAVIAIVIDDVGHSSANLELLAQIPVPMTLSVLPNLDFSAQAAERLHKRNEIILHLPMEPKGANNLEPDTILAGMEPAAVLRIMDHDLGGIKYAKGVSNHMGSKVTEDIATLTVVCAELEKRKLYFLDSFVTPKSVGATVARDTGVAFARRDVFLDNQADPAYIRQQLVKLRQKAQAKGAAIGIGHDRRSTLEVLKDELPRMAAEGYFFTVVSTLTRKE